MKSSAKNLTTIYDNLPAAEQKTLFDFAEFLRARAPQIESKPIVTEPLNIPRPADETVISAIKRMKQTYPMINRKHLFNKTSDLMMDHMMRGRKAAEVIDELEILFQDIFTKYVAEHQKNQSDAVE